PCHAAGVTVYQREEPARSSVEDQPQAELPVLALPTDRRPRPGHHTGAVCLPVSPEQSSCPAHIMSAIIFAIHWVSRKQRLWTRCRDAHGEVLSDTSFCVSRISAAESPNETSSKGQ
ncbi:hypothetical protein P7K49_027410, partial [Saguinus oedipus]